MPAILYTLSQRAVLNAARVPAHAKLKGLGAAGSGIAADHEHARKRRASEEVFHERAGLARSLRQNGGEASGCFHRFISFSADPSIGSKLPRALSYSLPQPPAPRLRA